MNVFVRACVCASKVSCYPRLRTAVEKQYNNCKALSKTIAPTEWFICRMKQVTIPYLQNGLHGMSAA